MRSRARISAAIRLCHSNMFTKHSIAGMICLLCATEAATLTAGREHRRTVDGQLCAAFFVQSGVAYTGCTDSTDPNGVSGRPWCYVEAQLSREKPAWGFCVPIVDYNAARGQAREEIAARAQAANQYIDRLHKAEAAAKDTLTLLQSRCG